MHHLQNELDLFPTKILKVDKAEYIQALVDSREKEDKAIFFSFMTRNHIKNLQSEIFDFKNSREQLEFKMVMMIS